LKGCFRVGLGLHNADTPDVLSVLPVHTVPERKNMKPASKPRKTARPAPARKTAGRTAARVSDRENANWTFLSNHGHVLVCLARNPDMRLRDVAASVGITERAVQKIIGDLERGRVLDREREGRRNRYHLHVNQPLRHPLEAHRSIGALLRTILTPAEIKVLGI
jgi:hypothetical protein